MSPFKSENLTEIIERRRNGYAVLWSPETAEHYPDYRELGIFPSKAEAEIFLRTG